MHPPRPAAATSNDEGRPVTGALCLRVIAQRLLLPPGEPLELDEPLDPPEPLALDEPEDAPLEPGELFASDELFPGADIPSLSLEPKRSLFPSPLLFPESPSPCDDEPPWLDALDAPGEPVLVLPDEPAVFWSRSAMFLPPDSMWTFHRSRARSTSARPSSHPDVCA